MPGPEVAQVSRYWLPPDWPGSCLRPRNPRRPTVDALARIVGGGLNSSVTAAGPLQTWRVSGSVPEPDMAPDLTLVQ